MKSGGADLRILPNGADLDRERIEANFRKVMRSDVQPSGYAIVTWDQAGVSVAAMYAGVRSHIPSIMIPDFVRNRLLAERIESWTIETVNASWGKP